jgi:hypothetical protein
MKAMVQEQSPQQFVLSRNKTLLFLPPAPERIRLSGGAAL